MSNNANQDSAVLVVYSGGLDSTTLLYWACQHYGLKNVGAISFCYGAKHNDKELACAKTVCNKLNVPRYMVDLKTVGSALQSNLLLNAPDVPDGHYADANMRSTVVPMRNGIMLCIAAGVAESHKYSHIAIGAHAGDHAVYPDCRPGFLDAMGQAIKAGTYANIGLLRPFGGLTKANIVREGLLMGIDYADTWSCYRGQAVACGRCSTCTERLQAFNTCGAIDPIDYTDRTFWRHLPG